MKANSNYMEDKRIATFGGGCFWCLEAVFQELKGVENIISGYAGGYIENPSYQTIGTGMTGHAEVIQITYHPQIISYQELLEVFWHVHDPTTLNRQGNDIGTQYRSIILFHNEEEKEQAEFSLKKTDESDLWNDPIVTEIAPFIRFYTAEEYHQNYYTLNKDNNPYCSIVIGPKIAKFKKEFQHLLKKKNI